MLRHAHGLGQAMDDECVDRALDVRRATSCGIRQLFDRQRPCRAAQQLPETEDPRVLEQLGKRGRARTYPASAEFSRCVALAFARNHYLGQSTETAAREFEKYSKECGEAIATIMANLTPDEDQSGTIEADEMKSANSILVERG
jgi:hypothetical protein